MKTIVLTLTLAAALALPAAAARPTPRTPHAAVATMVAATGTHETGARQIQDYAAREAAATDLESFEGGQALGIIGIILLVVLILLLI